MEFPCIRKMGADSVGGAGSKEQMNIGMTEIESGRRMQINWFWL